MITTVCLNPSFDKTVEVDHMEPGKVNRVRNSRIDLGGKGINVAVVAQRLGLDVECIGIMGENGAKELHGLMDREALRHEFLTIPGSVRTNLKVYNRDGSGVTELNEAGTEVNDDILERFFELAKVRTKESNLVAMTGSIPPGCSKDVYRRLMEKLEGKLCVLDTEGETLLEGIKAKPFLVKPNIHELESTLGRELTTMRSIRDAALSFIDKGVQNVVVSMGGMGAMYVSAEKTLFAPAVRVEAKSTVGAGDSMIGGMLLGYELEHDMSRAFRYGIAAGAACVMTEGTQLLNKCDFDALLDKVQVQEV